MCPPLTNFSSTLLPLVTSSYVNNMTYCSSGIPGPDHLSALSTTTELLQWLLPEDPQAVPRLEDEGAAETESEQLKPTMEISISTSQMKDFLKVDTEKDSPLKSLEKRLEVSERRCSHVTLF